MVEQTQSRNWIEKAKIRAVILGWNTNDSVEQLDPNYNIVNID